MLDSMMHVSTGPKQIRCQEDLEVVLLSDIDHLADFDLQSILVGDFEMALSLA